MGIDLGCVRPERQRAFDVKRDALGRAAAVLGASTFNARDLAAVGVQVSQDGAKRTALAVLAFPDVELSQIVQLVPEFEQFPADIQRQVANDALYAQYLNRQNADAAALQKEEEAVIPDGFVFNGLPGLSTELTAKLNRVRPSSLAQAGRIEGMTPAALTLILAHIRKHRRARAVQ